MVSTTISITGEQFLLNSRPLLKDREYKGTDLTGRLMNARLIQGIFDDENPETRLRWELPDGRPFDAQNNTEAFTAMLPKWKACGLQSFTIGLQGGSPEGYSELQPWINSAISPDGSLKPAYMKRLAKVLEASNRHGMTPIISIFYYAQVPQIKDERAIIRAVDAVTDWLVDHAYTHCLVEVANESNDKVFHHSILYPDRIPELIHRIQDRSSGKLPTPAGRLLVSTSFLDSHSVPDDGIAAADFVLLHGNDATGPGDIRAMVERVRGQATYRGQPIVFNEDDHYDFEADDNHFLAALDAGASWGYFDYRYKGESYQNGYQSMPCSWEIDSPRKLAFFTLLAHMTGGVVPAGY
jgi:hypothetical protein